MFPLKARECRKFLAVPDLMWPPVDTSLVEFASNLHTLESVCCCGGVNSDSFANSGLFDVTFQFLSSGTEAILPYWRHQDLANRDTQSRDKVACWECSMSFPKTCER